MNAAERQGPDPETDHRRRPAETGLRSTDAGTPGQAAAEHPFLAWLCARPRWALGATFLAAFLGAAAVSLVAGAPLPRVHDELSHLLAADTYARGRLANPPHPHWRHFEAPHVIQQPSYASKYPPAQGLVLAVGQVLTGRALVGLWLSVGLMSMAVTWMLQAWLPPRWALLGGALTALQFGLAGAWAQSYWGGAVPAAGGALLFGGLARAWRPGAGARAPTGPSSAAALAAGAVVLALSRPFEGLVVFVLVLASLLVRRPAGGAGARAAVAGALGAAVVLVPFLALHNEAVTGDVLTLPYQHHTRQYGAAPLFVFQGPPETPTYSSPRVARFHVEWETDQYERQSDVRGWLRHALLRPVTAGRDLLFGPPRNLDEPPLGAWVPGVLVLPLLLLPWHWRRARSRYALLVVVALFLALSTATYFVPHYVAVVVPLWMYLVVQSLRLCRAWAPSDPLRRTVVPLALCLSVVLVGQAVADQAFRLRSPSLWYVQKDRIEERLDALAGRHVVLVQYEDDYSYHREWVYNGADIDGQDVVWARSLGAAADSALLRYYADRAAWLLHLAAGRSELTALAGAGVAGP